MRRNAARARRSNGTRMALLAAISLICLTGMGAGIPAVIAEVRSAPAMPVPRGWPAAKVARMQAEDQLRRAAAGRPLLPPPPLPMAPPPAASPRTPPPKTALQGKALPGKALPKTDSGWQASLTQGIVPLTAGGPFRPAQFLGTNLWNGLVRGRWEVIQAGGVPADRALGAAGPARAGLFVYTRSPDPASAAKPQITGIRAPFPDPPGMFTVRKAHGDLLTLSLSGSPKRYYFNVVTLRFAR